MVERACAPICEISAESRIAGRRPVKVVLHEIFKDDSQYQENGVSWSEEYTRLNLHSVVGMSIVAEFLTDERDVPYGHGMTEVRAEDDLPLFEDATMVGHFDKAYVADVEIDGVTKRCLVAEGTLDEMRYPKFVAWLREHMAESTVKGSVEIVGKAENEGRIIYAGGWKERGRVPRLYDYSGYAILTVKPADEAAVVMELNNKTDYKEENEMDEQTRDEVIAAAVTRAVAETNSKWEEYWAKIDALEAQKAQLKADIAKIEAEKAQLDADFQAAEAAREAAEAGLTEANAARDDAVARLAEANARIAELEGEAAKAELNAALEPYNEAQREYARAEIDAFIAAPGSVEINSIIGKICKGIVETAREERAGEINSSEEPDIFGLVDGAGSGEGKVEIF